MFNITDNVRIDSLRPLISPALLMEELPITAVMQDNIVETRASIGNALQNKDARLVVVVGPCSIHDPKAALEYAEKLRVLRDKFQRELIIVMRIYFEKPRTTVGWKGLINDPHLDNSFDINNGLRIARKLLLDVNDMGLTAGTEFLDTISPQYISDLISWGAIGARTTESQIHRELASGLSMPIGFKNGTQGNIQIAIDAIGAAKNPHHFLSVTKQGIPAIVSTKGNDACHVILRGSSDGPNYGAEHIQKLKANLEQKQLPTKIMIDCSHGNSGKDHTKQHLVIEDICQQLQAGETAILGVMLESNLVAGKQNLQKNISLTYGKSITDACIDMTETEKLLTQLAQAVNLSQKNGTK